MSRRGRNKALPPAVQQLAAAALTLRSGARSGRLWRLDAASQRALCERLGEMAEAVEALDGVWYDRPLHDRILAELREIQWDARKVNVMLRMLARASGVSSEDVEAAMAPAEPR